MPVQIEKQSCNQKAMAVQVEGITLEVMKEALAQAKLGRQHILDQMLGKAYTTFTLGSTCMVKLGAATKVHCLCRWKASPWR